MQQYIIFTYSYGSLQSVKNLLKEMIEVFNSTLTPDDMFYFGVFCDVTQYANNTYLNAEIKDIPAILVSESTPYIERKQYVEDIMAKIMRREIEKPQWMIDIEQNTRCIGGCYSPSTFLYLEPKSDEYSALGKALISFLYSTGHESSVGNYGCFDRLCN